MINLPGNLSAADLSIGLLCGMLVVSVIASMALNQLVIDLTDDIRRRFWG